jgi:hypothetical protein
LDSFRAVLSYSLPLLAGFDLVEVDHGGRLPAKLAPVEQGFAVVILATTIVLRL